MDVRGLWELVRPRRTPWRAARVDPFVTAVEQVLAPLRRAQSKDPIENRALSLASDRETTALRDLAPIDLATRDHPIEVPGHPDCRVRVFWPTDTPAGPGSDLPVLVYFFGGAWTLGGIDAPGWDHIFRSRARDAGVIVVAGDYGLAPEVQWPAQPAQCLAMLTWTLDHLDELGGAADRVAIGGASSGGNLAAITTILHRDRCRAAGEHRPLRLQLLENPATALTPAYLDRIGVPAWLPRPVLGLGLDPLIRNYLGAHLRRLGEPLVSPLLADDLADLPPAVIWTGEMDALRTNGEAYARALAAAGVPTTAIRYIGATHTSGGLTGLVPAADHLHRDVITTLRTLHSDADDPVAAREILADAVEHR